MLEIQTSSPLNDIKPGSTLVLNGTEKYNVESVYATNNQGTVQLEPKPEPTSQKMSEQRSRELRSQYWTIRHDTVVTCGHKIDARRMPSRNCEYCWLAYFENYADIPQLHSTLQASGEQALVKQYGVKYVKQFKAHLKRVLSVLHAEEGDGRPNNLLQTGEEA